MRLSPCPALGGLDPPGERVSRTSPNQRHLGSLAELLTKADFHSRETLSPRAKSRRLLQRQEVTGKTQGVTAEPPAQLRLVFRLPLSQAVAYLLKREVGAAKDSWRHTRSSPGPEPTGLKRLVEALPGRRCPLPTRAALPGETQRGWGRFCREAGHPIGVAERLLSRPLWGVAGPRCPLSPHALTPSRPQSSSCRSVPSSCTHLRTTRSPPRHLPPAGGGGQLWPWARPPTRPDKGQMFLSSPSGPGSSRLQASSGWTLPGFYRAAKSVSCPRTLA